MKRILLVLVMLSFHSAAVAETLRASLDWSQRVTLGLSVSGVIARVAVQPGQRVEKGQLLVALDDQHLRARIARAEAELEEARQSREEGVRELQRATELYDRTVLSDHDLQLAQIGEARARAAWHRAQADLAEARVLLQQSRIPAPFAGLVVAVTAQRGQAVISGLRAEPLVELAQDSPLLARAAVSAEQAARLTQDSVVQVEIGGRQLDARLRHIGLEPLKVDQAGPLYELQVLFDRPDAFSARAGLPALIHVSE
ncbi:efflux RND transporter periplasmic adaptor subunit [Sedimenticola selenatireducens]|uniref:Efflux RND transporter periplasmic adaptor subunit n=1 Tax=Sedimenticola selenatireducens TaxID=191960 RepID=A0A2N6CUH3_9GAMM|nr:efflux RND transporter periplasmic adaptor subunit [Sedimenticola selenatireducens]PLX60816.1 MAG: efflux RND transporter periplasmic adaptor subunit [Sedimenticola selenatireducens]